MNKYSSIKWFHGAVEIFSYISSQSGEAAYTFISDYSPGVNITVSHHSLQIKHGFYNESVGSRLLCLTSPPYIWSPRQIISFSPLYLWLPFPLCPVWFMFYQLSIKFITLVSSQSYDVSPESSSRLELGTASMSASGLYTCLVTGGDIPFLEDSDSKTVMVASKS